MALITVYLCQTLVYKFRWPLSQIVYKSSVWIDVNAVILEYELCQLVRFQGNF